MHEQGEESISPNVIDDDSETEDESQEDLIENQCHLCRKHLLSKDDLLDHVQAQHEAYYLGMMEVAAQMSKSNILRN